jgi:hypothetical protein
MRAFFIVVRIADVVAFGGAILNTRELATPKDDILRTSIFNQGY